MRGIGSLPLLFLALEAPDCPEMEPNDRRSLSLTVVPLPSSSGAYRFCMVIPAVGADGAGGTTPLMLVPMGTH